ncbi:class I SAM-dependent DNA methyltransferase [Xanthomarina sp. F1114]|uniref:HsdM family class I SAM-dependent methyltransferase n=1 Tax=Xanthomarina sp. F1114 TaxID=2996019 RepID=UPI00225E65AE|nr:class I SAM-dependent DNA methyltransferase [Xanthomarina sp. F1114]MCX7549025.1 class I SAM-dependent DNA methyltransferase [Xanthomarina sp. F1114]
MTKDINNQPFVTKTKTLIDELKAVCASYGLGNDGNEFKIISQIFLFKFLNDKFAYEVKKLKPELAKSDEWEAELAKMKESDYNMLQFQLGEATAFLKPHHLIGYLFDRQNEPDFAKMVDDTLIDIAVLNNDLFAVKTEDGQKIKLFDRLTEYVSSKRDGFAVALFNKLVIFNFENIMGEGFDFFSTIFEYLIKDYNSDAGGKYAEYYTPHAVSKIIANILVPEPTSNVTIYDPSAGSGTLLMNLAHAIGPEKCTVYSQDISQKSSNLLRLNLVLNNLVHSIENVIQGNTMTDPYHKKDNKLRQFDYIVSNPPFKLDFSDDVDTLNKKENKARFFAGIPNVPKKSKDKMAIYTLFLQHIIYSLKEGSGKAAIVVPTGFITAQSGIEKKIRQKIVDSKMLAGVVSMPSNIFATTGTNVSIVFLDAANKGEVVLIDASNLGTTVKEDKNQKTLLSDTEETQIINTFTNKEVKDDFSVVVSYDDLIAKNYSLSAGQYFEVKIEYIDITAEEFATKMENFETNLEALFGESKTLEKEIQNNLKSLKYE